MQGSPGDFGKKFDEAVEAEIKKAKDAPAGTPKELKKAWQLFNKGDVAGALAECDKVGGDEALKAKDDFVARTTARIARAKWLIDDGYITSAEKLLEALEKGVKTDAELGPKIAEQKNAARIDRARAGAGSRQGLRELRGRRRQEEALRRGQREEGSAIATKHKGTKAAERAERFVALSKVKLEK